MNAPAPVATQPVNARPPRLFYLDFIRALATLLIVLTHFNNPYLANGGYLLTNTPFGIYVGALGVSLFLIISGAALTITYRRPLDLKTFYWKRFKGIYPMFWLAWFFAFIWIFVMRGGVAPASAPAKNLIFTVLGVDGLLANFHVPTAYLLGEWFLGFILIFYLIFPMLLWAVDRHPLIAACIGIAIYALSFAYFLTHPGYPTAVILTTRLPELMFGMYFAKYVRKVHWAVLIPAVALLGISSLEPDRIPEDIAVTGVGICAFLILVVIGRWVAITPVRQFIALIAKYSYPIFLVHHVVIMCLYDSMPWQEFGLKQRLVMFAATCAFTFILAVGLDRVTSQVVRYVSYSFPSQWWRRALNPNEP